MDMRQIMDMAVSVVQQQLPMMPMMVMNCTHNNVTVVKFDDRFGFTCDGCQEMGYGSCFKCINGCNYQLHEECQTATRVANHRFFEQRSFSLQVKQTPNTNNLCEACGKTVKGLRYIHSYQGGNIFLHPCCMKLPHRIETDDGDVLFLKKKLVTVECSCCERKRLGDRVDGWAYVSANQDLASHVMCMKEMMYESWGMYAHRDRNLEGPWWLRPYDDPNSNTALVQYKTPSNSRAGSSRPPQQIHNAIHQQGYNAAPCQQQGRNVVQYQQPYNNAGPGQQHGRNVVQYQQPYNNAGPGQQQGRNVVQYQQPYNNAGPGQQQGRNVVQYQQPYHNGGRPQDRVVHNEIHYHGAIQQYNNFNAPQQQHTSKPENRKGGMGWKLKAAAKLCLNVVIGNPIGVVSSVNDFLS